MSLPWPQVALAAWPTQSFTNLPVCDAPGTQDSPRLIPDGAGGMFVAFHDLGGISGDVFVHHILSDASLAPGWPRNGRRVVNAASNQTSPAIIADGSGGLLVAWQDFRGGVSYDLYAHHVLADGTLDPAWPVNGVPVCLAAGDQINLLAEPGDSGSMFLLWQDKRSSANDDLYAIRLLSNGSPAPGWPTEGLVVCDAAGLQQQASMISDGSGGVYLAWQDGRDGSTNTQIVAQHLRPDGSLASGWPVNGSVVCNAAGSQSAPALQSDRAGGALMTWNDPRNASTNTDVYAHHLLDLNGPDPGWPVNGLVVCDAPANQLGCKMVSDGAHGAILAWGDNRGDGDIYAHHLLMNGSLDAAWPAQGLAVCTAINPQGQTAIATDGNGGAIILWLDFRTTLNVSDLYAHHVTIAGVLDPAWPVNGTAVTTAPGTQASQRLITDTAGGAIALWQDLRFGSEGDLYAQRILANGTLGGDVVGVGPAPPSQLAFDVSPNPSRDGRLQLRFATALTASARLELFDLSGRVVATQAIPSSSNATVEWQPRVPAGMYVIRLTRAGESHARRVLLLRPVGDR
ncbi:MAG: T9SS type A sorting domain-containing protein [Candidatus Eisenbacteria bacterium]|nr:T9SS type A sorting domain-containing protein [Candidatus Eisenbacteria bacterium]